MIPAASARMSLPAVGDLAQLCDRFVHGCGTGAESYGWSRLTSLENVLSSPLLFCS